MPICPWYRDRRKSGEDVLRFQAVSVWARHHGEYSLVMCLIATKNWQIGFNDQDFWGWCITATYFIVGCLCLAAGRHSSRGLRDRARLRGFWFALAALMFALGCNKQLDLQTLLTQAFRDMARSGGWYGYRRGIQAVFVFICAATGVALVAFSLRFAKGHWRHCKVAYAGAIFLMTFIVIRTASFHHVDTVLYRLPGIGKSVNTGLELGGTLLVGIGSLLARRELRS